MAIYGVGMLNAVGHIEIMSLMSLSKYRDF